MSEWYLEFSWCRDELGWFFDAVRQKRADRPVFVVRVRATDHSLWPDVFKDERGHPLVGYDFVRDAEDNSLGLPKGYPSPENAPDSKDFYMAVGKLAGDIAAQMRALAQSEARPPARPPALREKQTQPGARLPGGRSRRGCRRSARRARRAAARAGLRRDPRK